MNIAVVLFDDFETLDVFGPVEVFGRLTDKYSIKFYSQHGGEIKNRHGVSIITERLDEINGDLEIFIIPGGYGTRKEVYNIMLIDKIKELSLCSKFVMTVCTGSALLARTGLLDGKQATSNKRAFAWAKTNSEKVIWDNKARWTTDEKYYTSSGVSAGIDMSLGFLSDRFGIEFARQVADEIEYIWTEDKDNDTFTAQV
jgi:putative intracellular protease/amidase